MAYLDYGFMFISDCINFGFDILTNYINAYVPFWTTLLVLLFISLCIKFFIAPFIGSAHQRSINDEVSRFRRSVSRKSGKTGSRKGSD